MAQSLSFSISKHATRSLFDEDISIEDFIEGVFDDKDGERRHTLMNALESQHYSDGGSPEVHDFQISDITFDKATKTGSFSTNYTVRYYFGCDGLNKDSDTQEVWDFKLNLKLWEIELESRERWSSDYD